MSGFGESHRSTADAAHQRQAEGRRGTFQSDEMMIAIDDAWLQEPSGTAHWIKFGMRVRATHPAVKLAPSVFVSADLDDLEIAQARRARLDAAGVHERS